VRFEVDQHPIDAVERSARHQADVERWHLFGAALLHAGSGSQLKLGAGNMTFEGVTG
jgi:hypothetical protein